MIIKKLLAVILVFIPALFTHCVHNANSIFIPVTLITGVPSSGTVGTVLLDGTVCPENASKKNVLWSVKNDLGTGAVILNNALSVIKPGMVTLTATVAGGSGVNEDYMQDFQITITENESGAPPNDDLLSALRFVKDLGVGINIGNTLDCIGTFEWTAGETGWGNPRITQDFIKALKNYGYSTIRLPVTWAENIGPAPDYAITTVWMNRVEEVVNWILGEDMHCILNLHHDGGDSDRSWIKDIGKPGKETEITGMFIKVWQQIASRFANASDLLILEAMNEVGFDSQPAAEAYRLINKLNQTFVDTVRAAGFANADRYLLVSGYWTDIDRSCDSLYKMPQDTAKNRLILSVHYYTPSIFCIAEKTDNSWGFRADWGSISTLASDTGELNTQFNKLKNNYLSKNIPVIIGEYGVTFTNKVPEGRVRWMTAVTKICLDNGICPVLWDTGGEIGRSAPFAMKDSLKNVWASLY